MRSVLSSQWLRLRLNLASALGIVCVALVVMSGMVHAAHFHASGTIDRDCALCVAAHQLAHAAPLITMDCTSLPVVTLTVTSTPVKSRTAVSFRLNSRPPPSGSARLA